MQKFIKILVSCLIFIIVVSLIAIGLIIYFVDPNTLKPVIIQEVEKKTGYKLVIDGQLTWTIYPRVGINIPRLTLAEPNQGSPFLELKSVKMVTPLAGIWRAKQKLSGDLQIAEVNFMKLNLHDAKVVVRWQDNALSLNPITANLYDGTLQAQAKGTQLAATPNWAWQAKLANIQIRSLLADLSQKKSSLELSGLAQVNVMAKTHGKSKDELVGNLAGDVDFAMQQGMVEGINLDFFVESADAILNKRQLSIPDNFKQTKFERLTASAAITEGIARTNNIILQSQTLTTEGQGVINLVQQTIDLKLTTKPQQQIKTQYAIPITIIGSLSNPNVNADMREIESKVAREVIDRLKSRVEDKITKFLGH